MNQQQTTVHRTLSVVAYLRNLFAEESFEEQEEGKMRMRIIRETEETRRFCGWIRAIEEHGDTICRVVLGIFRNGAMTESYSIEEGRPVDMKSICLFVQKQPLLSGRVQLRIKIYSMQELSLNGFQRRTEPWNVKGGKRAMVGGVLVSMRGMKALPVPEHSDKKSSASHKPTSDSPGNVRCPCSINTDDGEMVQCDECHKWSHIHCVGFFSNQDKRIPELYRCGFCAGGVTLGQRNLAIYRRCLGIIYNEPFQFANDITERLGIKKKGALYRIMKKMRSDGFLKTTGRSTDGYVVVKSQEVKELLKEYFSGEQLECSISIEEIICENQTV